MNKYFASVIFFLFLSPALASSLPPPNPERVEEEETTTFWDVVLFPFAIPPTLLQGLTLPFHSFLDWTEKVDLGNRAFDFFSNNERTAFWYPLLKIGGEGGFMMGLGASHRNFLGKKLQTSIQAQISPELDQEGSLSLSDPSIGKTPLGIGFSMDWKRRQGQEFFGMGNDALKRFETEYESRIFSLEVPLRIQLHSSLRGECFGRFFTFKDSDKNSSVTLSLSSLFSPQELIGFEQRVTGGEWGLRGEWDTRKFSGTPGQGTSLSFSWSHFLGNQSFSFFRTKISAAQYFSLFKPGRVLALGVRGEFVSLLTNHQIPFSLTPSLGGSSNLRGFDGSRFRDHALIATIAEYRYPIWQLIDGVLFVEGGRVGKGLEDLHPSGFHLSYGGGVRVRTKKYFFFQLQGAGSSDGARFVFSVNQSL